MKCFYHPELDAVGTCNQCNKTACRQCIEDVGGALLCVGCLSLHQQEAEREQQAIQQAIVFDREAAIQHAKNRIRWSWIVGGIGLVFGIFPGLGQGMDAINKNNFGALSVIVLLLIVIFFIILSGYMFWSMYWGIPVVWGWTKKFVSSFGFSFTASLPVWIVVLSCCISIPFGTAIYYSLLGGGIYQYFKSRRIAAGQV